MKNLIPVFIVFLFSISIYSQPECPPLVEIEPDENARKILLMYDKDVAVEACEIYADMGMLIIDLADMSNNITRYEYNFFSCGNDINNMTIVSFVPNCLVVNASCPHRIVDGAYQALNLTFPNGTLMGFNTAGGVLNPNTPLRGNILECILPIPPNIPTLSQWGLILLGLILSIGGVITLRSRLTRTEAL